MNKIVNEIYFDKLRWVMLHLKELDISSDEVIVILSIITLQEQKKEVNLEQITNLVPMSKKQVDNSITLLASKRYLDIKICAGEVSFNIDSIFKLEKAVNNDVIDLFKIFEEEFKRMLSQNELVRLNTWISKYSRSQIINALRNASIMDKLHFNYINAILENDKDE